VLVAEVTENGLRYRGHGISESRGLRKGVITNSTRREQHSESGGACRGRRRHSHRACAGGIAGAHIRGMNSHGGITFGARSREIGREEIRQAVDKARTVPLPAIGKSSICCARVYSRRSARSAGSHGMMATRLEVRVHM